MCVRQYGRVCPTEGGFAPALEGGWDVHVCVHVSLPRVLMGDEECVQVYMCMSVIVTCTYLCIHM